MIPRISSAREHQHDDEADGDQRGFQIQRERKVGRGDRLCLWSRLPWSAFFARDRINDIVWGDRNCPAVGSWPACTGQRFIVDAAAGLIGLCIAYIAERLSAFQKLGARI
jgi:hypothetical protein